MQQDQFKLLVDKFIRGEASEEEKSLLFQIYEEYQNQELEWDEELMGSQKTIHQQLFSRITDQIENSEKERPAYPLYRVLSRIAVAASIILGISFGGYFLLHKTPSQRQTSQIQKADLLPGSNKATLTLANGTKIILSDAQKGTLANQAGVNINKTQNGQIVYTSEAANPASTQQLFNVLTTQRGEQFQVILPDGTHVWLNAASSLKYPVAFNGKDRKVELTGEAYFEVVHNANQSFKVVTNRQTIEDIGTHFNINAYTDEPTIKTTLLEGAVKVMAEGRSAFLKPGEQTILNADNQIQVKNDANLDEVVAWKNGLFQFKKANIKEVMRQLSRWYNVDVAYEGQIPDRQFSGKLIRNVNASVVLDLLSYYQVHFRIEKESSGNKIIVTP